MLSALTQHPPDPLSAAFGEPRGAEGRSGSAGAKGYAARAAYQKLVRQDPTGVYSSVRLRLAEALETRPENLEPAALRTFFERKVPLGSLRGLTYQAFLIARMWELAEANDLEGLKGLVALSAVYVEQTAVDAGRHQLGWLLTGLPPPPFHLVSSQRSGEDPFGLLGDATWMAANLSYLRDIDFLEARVRQSHGPAGSAAYPGGQRSHQEGVGSSASAGRPGKARPKRSPKPAAKASGGGAGGAQ